SDLAMFIVPKPDRTKLAAKNLIPVSDGGAADPWRERCGDPVACWIHTPAVPLLKRMEVKDCVFGIPKGHLRPNTTYQVRVRLETNGNTPLLFCREFTTGT